MASAASAASRRSRAQGRFQQAVHHLFQRVEPLADGLLGLRWRSLEPPAGDLVEPSLLAAQPLQAKGLHRLRTVKRRSVVAGLLGQCSKGLVKRGLVKCRQIGNRVVSHA